MYRKIHVVYGSRTGFKCGVKRLRFLFLKGNCVCNNCDRTAHARAQYIAFLNFATWLYDMAHMTIVCSRTKIMAAPVVNDQSSRNVERVCQTEASHQEQPNVNLPRPAAKERVVGFDCEFVQRPPKAFQVDCPVCLMIVREPHQVTCCGYSFCQPCINRVERDKKPCPTCNEEEFSVFPNKGLQRAIYEYQVLCRHQKLGCQWVGELRELDDHLNESPILGRQFIGCEFAEVGCNDCGKSFQRQHFKAHQLEQHPFSCEYCHNYESYYEDVVKNHWSVCGFYPVPCTNECGVYPERQNLEHHVNKDCPLTVVNCDFHYADCEVQLPRKDMPAHLAENLVPHMAQLATYNQKKVQEKDQQIMQLTEDLRKEMEVNRQKICQLQTANEDLSKSLLEKKEEIAWLKEDLCAKDKVTTEKITELQEKFRLKEELLKQEITHLRQKQDDTLSNVHKIEEATKQELVQLAQKQDVAVMKLKQGEQENENKTIALLKTVQEDVRKQDETLRREVAVFRHMHEDAISRSEIMKREIGKVQGENETLTVQMRKVQEEVHKNEDMRQEISELRRNVTPNTPPVELTMSEFEKRQQNNDVWHSEPFYTHPHGYQLRLHVFANGWGPGKNTHVSVGVCLMQGDFDNHLSWPFTGDVSVMLLNQIDQQNSERRIIRISSETRPDNRVIVRESVPRARVKYRFLPHSRLEYNSFENCQFLKDDCLHFRVTRVISNPLKRVITLEKNQLEVKEQCLAIESRVCATPFQVTMKDFEQRRANDDIWFSPSFYTHPRGYRMCLGVYANGYDDREYVSYRYCGLTYVTVNICLMRGEWDNYLKWPFRGYITIQLLNQIKDKGHLEKTLDFNDGIPDEVAGRVTSGEIAEGYGWPEFISHLSLDSEQTRNCQYLKYDCLQFRIVKVELKD